MKVIDIILYGLIGYGLAKLFPWSSFTLFTQINLFVIILFVMFATFVYLLLFPNWKIWDDLPPVKKRRRINTKIESVDKIDDEYYY